MKQCSLTSPRCTARSHPSRVRGLKLGRPGGIGPSVESHPSRVRGLKLRQILHALRRDRVAPLAGAWIETRANRATYTRCLRSHPSRVRGLKLVVGQNLRERRLVAPLAGAWIETRADRQRVGGRRVAPLAGAWIETRASRRARRARASHPSRVRGLKLRSLGCRVALPKSHPSRVRGLKRLIRAIFPPTLEVAPLAGAWIETYGTTLPGSTSRCRTPRGCVD